MELELTHPYNFSYSKDRCWILKVFYKIGKPRTVLVDLKGYEALTKDPSVRNRRVICFLMLSDLAPLRKARIMRGRSND